MPLLQLILHYVLSRLLHSQKEGSRRETETYQQRVQDAEAAVATARGALGRDLAAAIAGQTWATQMRDVHDVRALAAFVDELGAEPGFIAKIHAAADRAREARGRGRGRPEAREDGDEAADGEGADAYCRNHRDLGGGVSASPAWSTEVVHKG